MGILALDATKLAEQTRLTTPFSGGVFDGNNFVVQGGSFYEWVPLSPKLRRMKGVLSKTITTNYTMHPTKPVGKPL